jgi:hypothetical protein
MLPYNEIIDDRGHSMKQQIISLVALFSKIPPGRLYVLEDLSTSSKAAGDGHNGIGAITTAQFIADVLRHLHR